MCDLVRPQAHPNYGFIKQLDVFWKCNFEPSFSHPAYRSWKRRNKQDVTHYLNHAADTVSIIEDKLLLTRCGSFTRCYLKHYLADYRVFLDKRIPFWCPTSTVVSSGPRRHPSYIYLSFDSYRFLTGPTPSLERRLSFSRRDIVGVIGYCSSDSRCSWKKWRSGFGSLFDGVEGLYSRICLL